MEKIEAPRWAGAAELRQKKSKLANFFHLVRRQPLGMLSGLLMLLLIVLAIFAPLIAPYDPLETHMLHTFQKPGAQFLLGTDSLGRDVLSRLIFGSRISLTVGLIAVGIGTLGGSAYGIISGYFGGRVDSVMQRIADSVMAFPGLVLMLTVVSVLGPGIQNSMFAISILIYPRANRIVRGATLSTKESTYVLAAHSIGATHLRTILRHILPNVTAPIIIIASTMLGTAILMEASLGFLGLGTPPPAPSWGAMLSAEGRRHMESAPWLAVFPGLAITLAVLAFNLLGDTLRDILDPRLRGSI